MEYEILKTDPLLKPYKRDIDIRINNYYGLKMKILHNANTLSRFANGYLYFGFHRCDDGWYFREWAPNAEEIALIGDFNGWDRESHPMKMIGDGIWEIHIPGVRSLSHGSKVKIQITANGKTFDRIPLYCKRVVQEEEYNFNGLIWEPEARFVWKDAGFTIDKREAVLIYECHVGMSGAEKGITTFREFTDNVLPRVKKLGYNFIQLMAIAEHPYYASFGYQVTNFYAVSSRFGTPEDLKDLINAAHNLGIGVLLDLVHSHASANVLEGIGEFDGTQYQFFHSGEKGRHSVWGTKLFNYEKPEVIHFLLSNIKFWMEEYHFDGFRFDGVTSMIYHNHGLHEVFYDYKKYFSYNTNIDAIAYLQLATELCKELRPDCILIAEDVSGMPGMCLPVSGGGIGFDYRLNMGMPDFWINMIRDKKDEEWDLQILWKELTARRPGEKVIGYSESHDQALVGSKTIMFWLADDEMYTRMNIAAKSLIIDRAIALHKMIRLITATCAGEGYLNFMGNEFGHPEWIDFPREGNGWDYSFARRRWDLVDNLDLRYHFLSRFDEFMIHFIRENNVYQYETTLLFMDQKNKIIVFEKGPNIFAFNFNAIKDYVVDLILNRPKNYRLVLNSGWQLFGGKEDETVRHDIMTEPLPHGHKLKVETHCREARVYACIAQSSS